MRAIGRTMAADLLVNNSDRFPLPCWDNEGNPGNLLFSELVPAVAIDQATCCIHPQAPQSTAMCERCAAAAFSAQPLRRTARSHEPRYFQTRG
jgi:hypothetical protein